MKLNRMFQRQKFGGIKIVKIYLKNFYSKGYETESGIFQNKAEDTQSQNQINIYPINKQIQILYNIKFASKDMDSGAKKLRQTQSIILTDTIITIAASSQNFAVGCLDDSIYVWNNSFKPFNKDPVLSWSGSLTGLLDIKFSGNGKKMATTSMDSAIRIWDLQTKQSVQIEVPIMSSWKLAYIDQNIVTCGQLGHIQFYNTNTKELIKKLEGGEIFFTSIANSNTCDLLAAGNNNGDLYIVNMQKKDKIIGFKPHTKMIRSLSFSEDSSKILSGSDDTTFKIFDIVSEKVISSYDGHKESVTCVRAHPTDNKVAFTCSFDKSIKIWDLRMKSCIENFQSGSALWALQPVGKHLIAGGQNGALSIFSVQ